MVGIDCRSSDADLWVEVALGLFSAWEEVIMEASELLDFDPSLILTHTTREGEGRDFWGGLQTPVLDRKPQVLIWRLEGNSLS